MVEKTLTLNEVLQLEAELNNFLGERLPLRTKYLFTKFRGSLKQFTKPFVETRTNLVKEMFPETGEIVQYVEGKTNPVYEDLLKKLNELVEEALDVKDIPTIDLEGIANIITNNNYENIFEVMVYEKPEKEE